MSQKDTIHDHELSDATYLDLHKTIRRTLVEPDFGPDEIRALMAKRGYTQQGLAAAVGVPQSTVSRWLSGARRPDRMTATRLQEISEGSKSFRILSADEFSVALDRLRQAISEEWPEDVVPYLQASYERLWRRLIRIGANW